MYPNTEYIASPVASHSCAFGNSMQHTLISLSSAFQEIPAFAGMTLSGSAAQVCDARDDAQRTNARLKKKFQHALALVQP